MRILVIGGTQFVGRHFVEAARERHELTLFHRGKTNRGLFDGVPEILGDRDGGLSALGDHEWDVVVDMCGYVPRLVRDSAEFLRSRAKRYVFISTISVYDEPAPGANEDAALGVLKDPKTEVIDKETYGPLKVACERVVTEIFGERDSLLVRPGLIMGPDDPTDRLTYWPARFMSGRPIAVPADGNGPLQVIDTRDLGAWVTHAIEAGLHGPYNLVGPREPLTMGGLFDACREALAPDAETVALPDEFLEEQGVAPWSGLPFWMPPGPDRGLLDLDHTQALAAGLRFRPLADSLRDTWEWHRDRGAPALTAGISPEEEEALLAAWAARAAR